MRSRDRETGACGDQLNERHSTVDVMLNKQYTHQPGTVGQEEEQIQGIQVWEGLM
jgi:hypothetical protein